MHLANFTREVEKTLFEPTTSKPGLENYCYPNRQAYLNKNKTLHWEWAGDEIDGETKSSISFIAPDNFVGGLNGLDLYRQLPISQLNRDCCYGLLLTAIAPYGYLPPSGGAGAKRAAKMSIVIHDNLQES
ncbi:MAG: hypothetical protein ACFBSG_16690 [Leptolyngbyaceae cyanobacterium]